MPRRNNARIRLIDLSSPIRPFVYLSGYKCSRRTIFDFISRFLRPLQRTRSPARNITNSQTWGRIFPPRAGTRKSVLNAAKTRGSRAVVVLAEELMFLARARPDAAGGTERNSTSGIRRGGECSVRVRPQFRGRGDARDGERERRSGENARFHSHWLEKMRLYGVVMCAGTCIRARARAANECPVTCASGNAECGYTWAGGAHGGGDGDRRQNDLRGFARERRRVCVTCLHRVCIYARTGTRAQVRARESDARNLTLA